MFSVGKAIEAIEYESNHPTSTTSKKICPYFFDNVKEESMISPSLLLLLEFPFVQSDSGGINPNTLDTRDWIFGASIDHSPKDKYA